MKYARLVARPDPERAPALLSLLAGSPFVTETRLYDWNLSREGSVTVLFEVDGDVDRFSAAMSDTPGVRSADATPVTDGRFTLLLEIDPGAIALLEEVFAAVTRTGIVVAKPVVYRDERIHGRIVGTAADLQATIRDLPAEVDIDVTAVGDFDRSRVTPVSALSERQREAVLEAADLGYYEHPRAATHEDVADRLGCAPNTASEHLQKAEAKIVAAVLELEFER